MESTAQNSFVRELIERAATVGNSTHHNDNGGSGGDGGNNASGMEPVAWTGMVLFLCAAIVIGSVAKMLKHFQQFAVLVLLCWVLSMAYMLMTHDDFVYARPGGSTINLLILGVNAFTYWLLQNSGLQFLQVPERYRFELRIVSTISIVFVTLCALSTHAIRYAVVMPVQVYAGVLVVMAWKSERRTRAVRHPFIWLGSLAFLGLMYGLAALLSHSFVGALGLAKALIFHLFTHILTVVFCAYTCLFDPASSTVDQSTVAQFAASLAEDAGGGGAESGDAVDAASSPSNGVVHAAAKKFGLTDEFNAF
jgi:hypothetical protein